MALYASVLSRCQKSNPDNRVHFRDAAELSRVESTTCKWKRMSQTTLFFQSFPLRISLLVFFKPNQNLECFWIGTETFGDTEYHGKWQRKLMLSGVIKCKRLKLIIYIIMVSACTQTAFLDKKRNNSWNKIKYLNTFFIPSSQLWWSRRYNQEHPRYEWTAKTDKRVPRESGQL